MPVLYNYFCFECGAEFSTRERQDNVLCNGGHMAQRVWGFNTSFPDQEHFNIAAGKYISSRHQLREHAKRESEAASIRTGIPHDFQVVDHFDKAALGVTQDGISQIANNHSYNPKYVRPLEK